MKKFHVFGDGDSETVVEESESGIWVPASVAEGLYEVLDHLLNCMISMHDDPEVVNVYKCHYDTNDLRQAHDILAKARGEQ